MRVERTVYVLDDDDAVLRSLERLLSSAGFEPIAFDNPDAFLAEPRRSRPVACYWMSACPA
jgi:two-component system response regulator FixJ